MKAHNSPLPSSADAVRAGTLGVVSSVVELSVEVCVLNGVEASNSPAGTTITAPAHLVVAEAVAVISPPAYKAVAIYQPIEM